MDIWFTQTHIAEIVELLKIKNQAEEEEDFKSGKKAVAGAPLPTKRTEPQSAAPVHKQTAVGFVTQRNKSDAERKKLDELADMQDVSYYMNAVGRRVYHTVTNKYATIVSCDGHYIVLRFDEPNGQTQEKSYSLAMCMRNKWLAFK